MDEHNYIETLKQWVCRAFRIPPESFGDVCVEQRDDGSAVLHVAVDTVRQTVDDAYRQRCLDIMGDWSRVQAQELENYNRRVQAWCEEVRRMDTAVSRATQSVQSFRYVMSIEESDNLAQRMREANEDLVQRQEADNRARGLLMEHLDNEQGRCFHVSSYFYARGSHSQGEYFYKIVPYRSSYQVDIYTANWSEGPFARACAAVYNHSKYDSALAAKMMIENYEPGFYMAANLRPFAEHGDCMTIYKNDMLSAWYRDQDPFVRRKKDGRAN